MQSEPIGGAVEQQGNSVALNKYQNDIAAYIAEMLMDLRMMAEKAQLGNTLRLIDAAYYEAYAAAAGNIQKSGRRRRT